LDIHGIQPLPELKIWLPNLLEEGTVLSEFGIRCWITHTYRTPVPPFEDQIKTGRKFMSSMASPVQQGTPVTAIHFL
jgi:hypothetical protein